MFDTPTHPPTPLPSLGDYSVQKNLCFRLKTFYKPISSSVLVLSSGLKFWRVGSRKLYAVKRGDHLTDRKCNITETSESFDEESLRKQHKGKSEVLKVVKELRCGLDSILAVNRGMHIPIGFRAQLLESFTCHICQSSPMKPPIMFAKCYRYIIGCQPCVEGWYSGEREDEKACPRSRTASGVSEI